MSGPIASEDLIGVWRLQSIRDRAPDGATGDHSDYGPDPDGLLVYTESGYISVQFMRRGRSKWLNEDDPTGMERTFAVQGYGAYAGRFEIDRARSLVHHHVEVALIPNRVGTTLTRRFSLSGDLLMLSPIAARHKGNDVERVLTWRRV